jgi:hypothetical protein
LETEEENPKRKPKKKGHRQVLVFSRFNERKRKEKRKTKNENK